MSQDLVSVLGADVVGKLRQLLAVGDVRELQEVDVKGVAGSSEVIGDRDAGGGSTASSWSEMVEDELVQSGLDDVDVGRQESCVTGVPVVSRDVKASVSFGGFGAAPVDQLAEIGGGMMAQFVRTDAVKGLRVELMSIGIKMPKSAAYMMALCTHTAATVPVFFRGGKDKLKTLAVLGDSSLVSAVAAHVLQHGGGCESVQQLRTTRLTDAHLARAFSKSRFARHVSVAAGVQLAHTKTGATALEAVVGLIAYYRTPADVIKLAGHFDLL